METHNGIKFEFEDFKYGEEDMIDLVYYLDDPTSAIYISHPYGGNEENIQHLNKYIRVLSKEFPNANFISPIHNFSYLEYSLDSYWEDLNRCIRLLGLCDYMFLIGDWKTSTGCKEEYTYCKDNDIPIIFITLNEEGCDNCDKES